MEDKTLQVRLNNKFVGVLQQDQNGKLSFQYAEKAHQPLSLSLPLESSDNPNKIYKNDKCKGFFNGLLPESDNVRKAIGKKYGVSPRNDFSLLKAIGYDCAGAVSFTDIMVGETPLDNLPEYFEIDGKILSDSELEKFITELPKKPLALGADGMRLSLAGAQDKTAIVLIDNKVAIPALEVPTTHILKPAIADLKETVENEYICMKAATLLGISVPEIEIRNVNGIKYFLIKRYDREIKNGKLKRIHQEDFCQASNVVSAFKYQAEGGVSFADCFEVLKKTSRPAVSIVKFLNMMVFNYLIGNNDAHGKNFSILHYPEGKIELAPAYDILSTQVYKDLSSKMAMKIGGHYEPQNIYPRHFEKFANEVGISYVQLKKIIKTQTSTLPNIVSEVISDFDNTIGQEILSIVNKNCKILIDRFEFD
ncbi:MAG: type II toxin-antitoxin system HipA family toxin [bacterium]